MQLASVRRETGDDRFVLETTIEGECRSCADSKYLVAESGYGRARILSGVRPVRRSAGPGVAHHSPCRAHAHDEPHRRPAPCRMATPPAAWRLLVPVAAFGRRETFLSTPSLTVLATSCTRFMTAICPRTGHVKTDISAPPTHDLVPFSWVPHVRSARNGTQIGHAFPASSARP
jgi:hypothetical protein